MTPKEITDRVDSNNRALEHANMRLTKAKHLVELYGGQCEWLHAENKKLEILLKELINES